jgi:hypothetical protein
VIVASIECIRFVAHADDVPLLGTLWASGVIGVVPFAGGYPRRARTDLGLRSDDDPRRAPPSRKPGCLSPPRHAKELLSRRDCSLRPSRRLSRSRRPHFVPRVGDSALIGHCKARLRSPAGSVRFESADAFVTRWNFVPGADDPSTPSSSTDPAVDEDRLPRSHRCRSQRLDGFYDQESAARCAAPP